MRGEIDNKDNFIQLLINSTLHEVRLMSHQSDYLLLDILKSTVSSNRCQEQNLLHRLTSGACSS